MKRSLAAGAAAAALLAAGSAGAANPTETVRLTPVAGAGVTGTVTAGQRGAGTHVRFALRGLAAGTNVRAVMNAGTCRAPGASFATAGSGSADGSGRAAWDAAVRFRGQPVAWSVVADGGHVFRLVGANGRTLACGVVPGMS